MTEETPVVPTSQVNPMKTESFEQLLQRFDNLACGAEAFSVATWMFSRFPTESKKLLPLIRDEELGCDGKNDATASNHEWAAALVAAKKIKLETGRALETVTEVQAHDSIVKFYNENHKGGGKCQIL